MTTRFERMNDKAQNERHTKILQGLLQLPENKFCAECKRKDPRWASYSLGVFVCLRCSGIHRSLGTHISRMKSVDLDSWTPEQVQNMVSWGNAKANWYWQARATFEPNDSNIELFIRCKYERRQFVQSPQLPDPTTIPVGQTSSNAIPSTTTTTTPLTSFAPFSTTFPSSQDSFGSLITPGIAPTAPTPPPSFAAQFPPISSSIPSSMNAPAPSTSTVFADILSLFKASPSLSSSTSSSSSMTTTTAPPSSSSSNVNSDLLSGPSLNVSETSSFLTSNPISSEIKSIGTSSEDEFADFTAPQQASSTKPTLFASSPPMLPGTFPSSSSSSSTTTTATTTSTTLVPPPSLPSSTQLWGSPPSPAASTSIFPSSTFMTSLPGTTATTTTAATTSTSLMSAPPTLFNAWSPPPPPPNTTTSNPTNPTFTIPSFGSPPSSSSSSAIPSTSNLWSPPPIPPSTTTSTTTTTTTAPSSSSSSSSSMTSKPPATFLSGFQDNPWASSTT